ncbi:permease prefix domain 1-containing protein [Deinococcus humi]|uniref:Uncharacterized protein n=1 Tax=Deinococcus humi TaxID=662880 RepID=A0A7W8JUZ5_9DEIO|nr:permease prefix domain 1-containing protein [Deinococcus humi]MBB5363702.1 hypothetical protein [Deinococcus humi]GGO29695.1 hypothetical protein GCM10008949_23570 [Deinococcus humi]
MKSVHRYLQQATRGLWGQKRRDAQTELRGAIEDKVYRHRLLGLSETEAITAALRDLGSPRSIARDLNEVHTVPQMLKIMLLVGVGATLSFQAAAQVPTVQSAYLPSDVQPTCRFSTPQERSALTTKQQEETGQNLKAQGGSQQFLENCLSASLKGRVLLNVADLMTALRAGGIAVPGQDDGLLMTVQDGDVNIVGQDFANAASPLFSFTGNRTVLPGAVFLVDDIQGQRYLNAPMVIPFLKQVLEQPLHLNGLTNPVLSVGQVNLQLGSPAAPVQATDLLAFALLDERRVNSALPLPVTLSVLNQSSLPVSHSPRLTIKGQDGELFAVLQNSARLRGGEVDLLSVQSLSRSGLDVLLDRSRRPLIVGSVAAMDAATAQGKEAVIVYRLNASDLRDLKLTLVPASQIEVQGSL